MLNSTIVILGQNSWAVASPSVVRQWQWAMLRIRVESLIHAQHDPRGVSESVTGWECMGGRRSGWIVKFTLIPFLKFSNFWDLGGSVCCLLEYLFAFQKMVI